jgi:hypothetical protein
MRAGVYVGCPRQVVDGERAFPAQVASEREPPAQHRPDPVQADPWCLDATRAPTRTSAAVLRSRCRREGGPKLSPVLTALEFWL